MPKRKRIQREHTEDWPTIKQYTLWPEQAAYELLRPIVLFGDPAIGRAEETGEAKSTLDRKADAFEESGMVSLLATKPRKQSQETARSLPPDMRQLIVDLRVELSSLSLREIAEICDVRCGGVVLPGQWRSRDAVDHACRCSRSDPSRERRFPGDPWTGQRL